MPLLHTEERRGFVTIPDCPFLLCMNPGGCNACLQRVSDGCSANWHFPRQKKWTDVDNNFCSLIPGSIIY